MARAIIFFLLVSPINAWAAYRVDRLLSNDIHPDAESILVAVSGDGRYVAFSSKATNLVDIDTLGLEQIYVVDRVSGEPELVSISPTGSAGNLPSRSVASISVDGRFVAFQSRASNLVAGDTNDSYDTFVRDRTTGQTERVSVSSAGVQGDGRNTRGGDSSISANGRFVAFDSTLDNLVENDGNGARDVFIHDRVDRTTRLVSIGASGELGNGNSYGASISADGRYVAFASGADNLVGDDKNDSGDYFVHDLETGQTERASIASDGSEDIGHYGTPRISANGRFVVFDSYSANLVPGDTNDEGDVFIRDRLTGLTEKVSIGTVQAVYGRLSGDGRYVALYAGAGYLPGSNVSGHWQYYIHDRMMDTVELISVDENGLGANGRFHSSAINADGSVIVLSTEATNFDAQDLNGVADIYSATRINDTSNQRPIADAGVDQAVVCTGYQTTVGLDGSGSSDSNGDALTYFRWMGAPDPEDVVSPTLALDVGQYEFSLAVSDGGGWLSEEDTVSVNVQDFERPSLSVSGALQAEAQDAEGSYPEWDIESSDNCDRYVRIQMMPRGPYPVGTTQVTVSATDKAGNARSQVVAFTVVDTTPPELIAPPAAAARATGTLTPVTLGNPTASDIAGPVTTSNDAPVAGFPLGVTLVTWTARDGSGNTTSAQQTVTVRDTLVAAAPMLYQGRVDGVDEQWRTVVLPAEYIDPVVVASVQTDASRPPVVTRIRNASVDRFEVRVQNPGDEPLDGGFSVYYLVVEAGVYTEAEHGIRMEAARVVSRSVNGHFKGWYSGWVSEAQPYANAYTNPVVLGQVMSFNDARWSVFWSSGADRRLAPDEDVLWLSRHIGDDNEVVRQLEEIGYIVIEAGDGAIDGVAYEAGVSNAVVRDQTGASPGTTLRHDLARVSGGVVSSAGMLGADGGWPVLFGSAPFAGGGLDVAIAEDQLLDDEFAHKPEQVAYLLVGSDAPVDTGPYLQRGRVDGVGDTWQTVTLPRTYTDPVVVATVQYNATRPPAVARVRQAVGNSFELRVQNPSEEPVAEVYRVHDVVAEAGVYNEAEHGIRIEAARVASTLTDGARQGWSGEQRNYANRYAHPVVLGQVMSANDPRWSVFWARGAVRESAPDKDSLWLGKHVGEDPQTERAQEEIGYIVLESGHGRIGSVGYEVGVSERLAGGTQSGTSYALAHGLDSSTGAVLSAAAMRGGNGGWPVLFATEPFNPTSVEVAFEEDQLADDETYHRTEQLGYLVFE